ncbi:hypothetical protein GX48_05248 [Paracoccidioides brasiliensis]|nr:hypothetical protein GX48_05248 [Paracoccidioides brasiliensis]
MYSQHGASMAPPQKPETFMLSNEAQQSLPQDAQVALQQVDNLKYFLISAPVDWSPDQLIRRFLLPTGDYVSCVLWNNLFHISGTDIVRCLSFRFQAFGRPVKNTKKFEEGIFSDLRNLKSGTDASLEEPKSAFLDFLYKNNCIRTQKKQKVFYWYSVPHDRLFLDALERDLKREKMGQEATTVAVNEPALSFEFDSSQSLFEQLTKAQQANSSSFSAHANTAAAYATHSTSPMGGGRATDSMPPPQIPQPAMSVGPEDNGSNNQQGMYHNSVSMSNTQIMNNNTAMIKPEQELQFTYDRNGLPISRIHTRHTSMPTFMEYSPAPSFVSSHYDDYPGAAGARGISFEPITPPQHPLHNLGPGLGAESAYIANEDTGLYTAIPDLGSNHSTSFTSAMMMQLPPSNFTVTGAGPGAGAGGHFSTATRMFPSANVYSVIEGSPTYKQRRRRSSIPPAISNAIATAVTGNGQTQSHSHGQAHSYTHAHAVSRPSDLRRSMSSSVAPVPVLESEESSSSHDSNSHSPPGLTNSYISSSTVNTKDLLHELSRTGTPLPSLEENVQDDEAGLVGVMGAHHHSDGHSQHGPQGQNEGDNAVGVGRQCDRPGPVRRARSATMMELGPYPQKSHSCPIPSCGRLFKRLEHLKRHVRTHTQERPYPCPYCNRAFSRSDNLAQHRRIHESQQQGGGQSSLLANFSDEDHENENENEQEQDDFSSPSSVDLNGNSNNNNNHSQNQSQNPNSHNNTSNPNTSNGSGSGNGNGNGNGNSNYMVNLSNVTSMPMSMPSMSMSIPMPSMVNPQVITPQLLQQHI